MSWLQESVEQFTTALGWAVLHSLWQCALVGAIAAGLLMLVRGARERYLIWMGGVFVCFGWFVVTVVGGMRPETFELSEGFGGGLSVPAGSDALFTRVIAWLWAGGFVFCSLRFGHQCLAARRLRTDGIVAIEAQWAEMFASLRKRIGVSGRVRLLASNVALSPMVVGWLSPVVIVPVSVLSALSPEQVRLVLVHELTHIRRFDHLINALQVLIETVLFFHPVVWWMSRQARTEREHCCDDAAVRWAGDAVMFARALTELERTRTNSRAVLALNQGGSLMERITRILGTSGPKRISRGSLRTAAALTVGALVASAGIVHAAMEGEGPAEVQIQMIRSNVQSGVLTEEQARELYDRLVYPNSDVRSKLNVHLEQVRAELAAMVTSGEITEEQEQEKLAHVKGELEDHLTAHFLTSVLGMSEGEAKFSMMADKMEAMVARGELTREQADEKLALVEIEIAAEQGMRDQLRLAEAEIRAAVDAGEITPEEGRERMRKEKRRVEARVRHARVTVEIEAAVERGEITRAEANAKYSELHNEMVAYLESVPVIRVGKLHQEELQADEGDDGNEVLVGQLVRIDWDAVARRIEGAVERGEMTRAEAKQAYESMDLEEALERDEILHEDHLGIRPYREIEEGC